MFNSFTFNEKTFNASSKLTMIGSAKLTAFGFAPYFYVTKDKILRPLDVLVLRDSRYDLLPGTRENTESIPGQHGEIDFGSEFLPRNMELDVITLDITDKKQIERDIAKHLNPTKGNKSLVFADDIEKTYFVKYAGRIQHKEIPHRVKFTIPFKSVKPFIIGTFINEHKGDGTVTNKGTYKTPLIIEITGIVTDPSVQIGNETLSYSGTLGENDKLIVDTEKMTVTFNGQNAIAKYSGGFPELEPGDTQVIAANEGVTTFKWYDRWV